MDHLIKRIEKLEFQMRLVGESLSSEDNLIASIVISLNWGNSELNTAHDIFEKFDKIIENGQTPNWGEFEQEFKDRLGINNRSLKIVVLGFFRNSQWTEVCTQYAQAHECIEFHSITKRI